MQNANKTQTEKLAELLETFKLSDEDIMQVETFLSVVAPESDLASNLGILNQTTIDTAIEDLNLTESEAQMIRNYATAVGNLNISFVDSNATEMYDQAVSAVFGELAMQYFGDFRVQRFNSSEELEAYLLLPEYGRSADIPAVCFGYSVIENASNDYEVELMFNDLWPPEYRGIPSQKMPASDPTITYPLVLEYENYIQGGYLMM